MGTLRSITTYPYGTPLPPARMLLDDINRAVLVLMKREKRCIQLPYPPSHHFADDQHSIHRAPRAK